MNVGETGLVYYQNVNYDMSGNTSLSLVITRPDGTVITKTNPAVTISSSPLVTPIGTFAANQYALYTIATGDLTVPGDYSARVIYNDASKHLISSVGAPFTVNA